MKNIFIILIFLTIFITEIFAAQPIKLPLDDQPDSVGLCLNQDKSAYTYGTLFEETNTYFVSCGHENFYPQVGKEIIFGNGEKIIVDQIWVIGTGRTKISFDLVIGKLRSAVNTTTSQAWWHLPKSFFSDKDLTGFALHGHYTGSGSFWRQPDVSTDCRGIFRIASLAQKQIAWHYHRNC
jgi:hypothetical protein